MTSWLAQFARHGDWKRSTAHWDLIRKIEWGMINGKLSALCWFYGENWDELYT
jgi:hypothetical protein